MNNKENLLNTALDLFSKKGFSGVSVRDICGSLGLKESALYYHFKNKEAILNALYSKVDNLIMQMKMTFDSAFTNVTKVTGQEMCLVAVGFLKNYYCDETVLKLLAMLSIERMSDQTANQIYQKLYYDLPLEQCQKIFLQMKERNIIRDLDCEYLAKEYLCAISFAFDRFIQGQTDKNAQFEKAVSEVTKQISLFFERIAK